MPDSCIDRPEKYRLIERLAPGHVLAQHLRMDRLVEVYEFPRNSAGSPDVAGAEKLQTLCSQLAGLDHPSIPHLLDLISLEEKWGVVWEAFRDPLLTHQKPAETGKRSATPPQGMAAVSAILDPFHGLVDAIAHAHERGVYHGSLNGGTVQCDSLGHLRVIGLGISQLRALGDGSPRTLADGFLVDLRGLGSILESELEHRAKAARIHPQPSDKRSLDDVEWNKLQTFARKLSGYSAVAGPSTVRQLQQKLLSWLKQIQSTLENRELAVATSDVVEPNRSSRFPMSLKGLAVTAVCTLIVAGGLGTYLFHRFHQPSQTSSASEPPRTVGRPSPSLEQGTSFDGLTTASQEGVPIGSVEPDHDASPVQATEEQGSSSPRKIIVSALAGVGTVNQDGLNSPLDSDDPNRVHVPPEPGSENATDSSGEAVSPKTSEAASDEKIEPENRSEVVNEPASPELPTRTSSPFLNPPRYVELPESNSREPIELVSTDLQPHEPLQLELLGLENGSLGGSVSFELRTLSDVASGSESSWGIDLVQRDRTEQVARFERRGGKLQFQWDEGAVAAGPAPNLQNGCLKLSSGTYVSFLPLRRPMVLDPVTIDLDKPSRVEMRLRFPPKWEHVFMEIVSSPEISAAFLEEQGRVPVDKEAFVIGLDRPENPWFFWKGQFQVERGRFQLTPFVRDPGGGGPQPLRRGRVARLVQDHHGMQQSIDVGKITISELEGQAREVAKRQIDLWEKQVVVLQEMAAAAQAIQGKPLRFRIYREVAEQQITLVECREASAAAAE